MQRVKVTDLKDERNHSRRPATSSEAKSLMGNYPFFWYRAVVPQRSSVAFLHLSRKYDRQRLTLDIRAMFWENADAEQLR